MGDEKRLYEVPLPVASTATLTISIVLSDTVGAITLNSSDAAYQTITGSSSVAYRPEDYAQQLASKLKTWLDAAVTAEASITTKGSRTVTLSFAEAITRDGSRWSLAITLTGASNANGPITITSATIDNATGAYSPLGLVYETATGTTTRSGTVSPSTTVTWAGLWQPRSQFCFLRSEADFGNAEKVGRRHVHYLGDGSVRTFTTGFAGQRRTMEIRDLEEGLAGRSEVLGRLASSSPLSSDRVTLSLQTASTTSLSGVSSLYYNSDAATAGYFVRVPCTPRPWFARLKTGASSSSVVLVEKIPTGYTPIPGGVLTVVSEAHALWAEAMRLETLIVHPVKDSDGTIRYVSEEYAVLGGEEPEYAPSRHSAGVPLYSYRLDLLKNEKTGLTLAS